MTIMNDKDSFSFCPKVFVISFPFTSFVIVAKSPKYHTSHTDITYQPYGACYADRVNATWFVFQLAGHTYMLHYLQLGRQPAIHALAAAE
jgi:hypothetical protein